MTKSSSFIGHPERVSVSRCRRINVAAPRLRDAEWNSTFHCGAQSWKEKSPVKDEWLPYFSSVGPPFV